MIYDCFTFFNELDLLEIRLNILDKVADKFVIVEATRTHQGQPKPLYFQDNKDRYAKYLDRIIHVVVEQPDGDESAWAREHRQRNSISRGLKECSKDDVIIISDVDEIPDPRKVTENVKAKGIRMFRMRTFYYYINCIKASDLTAKGGGFTWNGTVMVNYSEMGNPQDLRELCMRMLRLYHPRFANRTFWKFYLGFRNLLEGRNIKYVNEGGWHFSYLGGVERIIKKLEAFAHAEYNNEQYKDPKKIEEAIKNGKDIFGRGFEYKFIPLDSTFPKFIVENAQRYSNLINLEAAAK